MTSLYCSGEVLQLLSTYIIEQIPTREKSNSS